MKLKKGDKIHITKDYEWKYGEPSIYNDEMLWYLIIKVNHDTVEPEDEDKVLKRCLITYREAMDKLNTQSELKFTI